MTIIETPVCIIGAGPSGSTASLFLSQYGIPHVMADRATFPRDKVCGEVFSGRVSHVLRELGLDFKDMIAQGILQETRSFQFVIHPEGKSINYDFSKNSTSILKGKRSVFDGFLNDKARQSPLLTYLDHIHLNKFERLSGDHTERSNLGGVLLTSNDGQTQVRAQIVLFCTGERVPFLQNIFSNAYPSKGKTLLVWRQYFKNVHYDIINYGCEAHIYTQPCNHYVIINPLPDNLTLIEMYVTKVDFHKHKISLESLFEAVINSPFALKARFQYATPLEKGKGTSMLLGENPRLLSADRALLAGSAAGSIHPVTGYGVGHAMRMGQLAAFHAAKSIEANDFSASYLKAYDKEVRKRMRDDFRLGYILDFLMQHFTLILPLLRPILFSKRMAAIIASKNSNPHSLNLIAFFKKIMNQERYSSKSNNPT